jgi:hypothetical protein
MLLRIAIVAVGLALNSAAAQPQTRCKVDTRPDELATRFIISAGSVKMPLGAFLLVRKDSHLGAIRLTSINTTATEWVGKSIYESFFQPDSSRPLVAENVVKRTGELNVQRLKGPGRGIYVYQPGNVTALIGGWRFGFGSPSMMTMSDTSFWTGVGDHGYEFAPTSACDISEVDAHDKRLHWFRFDRNASITLPLSDLPK